MSTIGFIWAVITSGGIAASAEQENENEDSMCIRKRQLWAMKTTVDLTSLIR